MLVILTSNLQIGRLNISASLPLGSRCSAGGLSEQDLLAVLGYGGAAGVRLASGVGPLCPGALAHHVEPAPQVREVIQILLLTYPWNDPGVGSHVCKAVVVADDEYSVLGMNGRAHRRDGLSPSSSGRSHKEFCSARRRQNGGSVQPWDRGSDGGFQRTQGSGTREVLNGH